MIQSDIVGDGVFVEEMRETMHVCCRGGTACEPQNQSKEIACWFCAFHRRSDKMSALGGRVVLG